MIAVDTNLLVGAIRTFDPQLRAAAQRAVKSLYRRGEQLLCFPQNLVEFCNASTRAATGNGLGFSPELAARYLDQDFWPAPSKSMLHSNFGRVADPM
jgi:predicted nucleic acid-binding protein